MDSYSSADARVRMTLAAETRQLTGRTWPGQFIDRETATKV